MENGSCDTSFVVQGTQTEKNLTISSLLSLGKVTTKQKKAKQNLRTNIKVSQITCQYCDNRQRNSTVPSSRKHIPSTYEVV